MSKVQKDNMQEDEVEQVRTRLERKQSKFSLFIPLIMVPIVTRLMPDSSYYGISDLSNTVLSFGSALAVMGMYDAMYRMFVEKDDENYKK